MVQFGDVEYKDGDGGVSSFKKKYFADENFDVGTQPGVRRTRRGTVLVYTQNGTSYLRLSYGAMTQPKKRSWL